MQLQFAANAYQARSKQLINQQCINAFVEPSPREGKTQLPVYGIPGLALFSRQGDGPILGMHIMNDTLCILSGPKLYVVQYSDVQTTLPGTLVTATFVGTTTLGGLTSMADNAQQLVMVDGSSGWVYQPGGLNIVSTATAVTGATSIAVNLMGGIGNGDTLEIPLDSGVTFTTTSSQDTGPGFPTTLGLNTPLPSTVTAGAIIISPTSTIGQIIAPAFQNASVVRYFDGYFVFNAINTRQFFISGINDGTQYSGLDFATASAGSDQVIGIEVYHEQLLIFCQLQHTEVWWDTGNVAFPFQRYDVAFIARGLAAPYCVCSEDNTVFWMGDDGIFYRLNGFSPERISTFAMEHAWAQYPSLYLDASCFVLDQEGHKFIIINFPSGSATWVFDIATKLWHQRESWGTAWP